MSFVAFACAHGLRLDHAIPDGRWHRTPTEDKPRKRNGAYLWTGERGVVINFATMIQGAVWREGGSVERVDREAIRKMQARQREREQRLQNDARLLASLIIEKSTVGPHPYLAAKGFPEETGLFYTGRHFIGDADEQKEVVLDQALVVPMRDFALYKRVNSVQYIARDGMKLFLPYGKARGSVYLMGPMMPSERWIVEGLATGLSVRAALRSMYRDAQIVICFSAGNLAHVGALARELRPQAYVMADHDHPNKQNGKKAGEEAAKATGLPWVMPPDEGDDANDLHQRAGVRALAKLMLEATVRARAA